VRISWTTTSIGTLHKDVPDEEAEQFCTALTNLGFEPTREG
jgi:hypothetical protein